ncbi:MAG: methionine gamma-lyase family protein [Bacilli bacterium]|nr:methionine gamma-lyase family protein [Bacilli bacterium]
MKEYLKLEPETWNLYEEAIENLQEWYSKIDKIQEANTAKVLDAFWKTHISEAHFSTTTGYGYNDIGRDAIESVYAMVFKAEDALVRNQFISGSHALSKTLFGILRPGDKLLSISGRPYDTLHQVIGITDNPSSLKSFGVQYDEIDLVNNDFDEKKIEEYLKTNPVKMIEIQRSRGYSTRETLSIEQVQKIIQTIKKIQPQTIVMVDNCYCEFVGTKEPIEVGADLVVGSLIKNLGGGLAQNGGYVVGKKKYIELVAEALTLPGEGKEVGPSLGANKSFLQGLFLAPQVVASSLKTAILTSYMLEKLGYEVNPNYQSHRSDIVQTITFHNKEDLISYCSGIQKGSPIDSFATTIPVDMPGYKDQVIMAAGAFVQGSSIELSCDGPIREPYIAFQQGGLTFDSAKIGVLIAVNEIIKKQKGGE